MKEQEHVCIYKSGVLIVVKLIEKACRMSIALSHSLFVTSLDGRVVRGQ